MLSTVTLRAVRDRAAYRPADSRHREEHVALIAALVVSVVGCLVVARAARHVTFSGDDWTFITQRRGFTASVFLRPHNEHLSALPIAAYKLLLAVFGASSYTPFMALLLVVHGVTCLLLYIVARRYVGPWLALAPLAILVVLGPAWQDLLWAFQVGYLGSLAAGLGMVACLERRTRGGDIAATLLLCVSLLCSSVGLAIVVLGAVMVALAKPRDLRRSWVIAVPVALYLLWYAFYGVTTIDTHNIVRIPKYDAQALAAAVGSITGLARTSVSPYLVSTGVGRYLALVGVIALIVHLMRGGRLPSLAWAALVAAIALWTAECLEYSGPARSAAQSRYQYPAAVLVLLVMIGLVSRWRVGRMAGALIAILVVLIGASNASMLDQRAGYWTLNAAYTSAETGAILIARDSVAADFSPENLFTIPEIGDHNIAITAGPYLSAVRAFGSAADRPPQLLRRPESIREAVDLVLAGAEGLKLLPSTGFNPLSAGCRSAADGAALGEFTLRPGTITVRVQRGSGAELQLRRFASAYRFVDLGQVVPAVFHAPALQSGQPLKFRLPADTAAVPWHARVIGGRNVTVCT